MLPIWVLNLRRSHARRAFMQRQLEAAGFDFEFVEAVDGRGLTPEHLRLYDRNQAMQFKGRELAPGEVGCALAHLQLYERIVQQGVSEVLILEDDVALTGDFWEILWRRDRYPSDWEAINLNNRFGTPVPFGEPILDSYRMCRFASMANNASAYIVKRVGAVRLLDAAYPIRLPADDLLGRTELTGLCLYGVTPRPLKLGGFHSEIWAYKWQWWELAHDEARVGRFDLWQHRRRAQLRHTGRRLLGRLWPHRPQ